MNKLKVGLYSFGKCHTIDKYFQIMSVLDKMKSDDRFEIYLLTDGTGIADKDLRSYISNEIDLRFVNINESNIDFVFIIDPYSRPITPYYEWKVPIVYKEYGVAGAEAGAGYLIKRSAYRYADLIITDNEYMRREINEEYPSKLVIVGSPAFDYVVNNSEFSGSFTNIDKDPLNVLWTPHHSLESNPAFDKIEGGSYSTFIEYKDYLVTDFLRDNPNVNLMIKYHPILPRRYNSYCKSRGIDDTFSRWMKLVKQSKYSSRISFYNKTDYHKLFEKTDIILNDSISFLQEWLPTKKPMVVLRSDKSSKFSSYGESLINKCYMSVSSVSELSELFSRTPKFIILNNDTQEEIDKLYMKPGISNSTILVEFIYDRYSR